MSRRIPQGRTVETLERRRLFCVLHVDGYVTDFPSLTAGNGAGNNSDTTGH